MEILLFACAALLAFGNGANDNFKGFATVWGSRTLTYRRALVLATTATVLGSLMSLLLAETLLQQFSGKGLVPDAVAGSTAFIASVGSGAAITILLATRLGFPISTTHALIGGLVGAGLMQEGAVVHFSQLAKIFVIPLLLSPLIAALLSWLAHSLLRRRKVGNDCACLVAESSPAAVTADATVLAAPTSAGPRLVVAPASECEELSAPVAKISIASALDRIHVLSAASICFARGVNDTPKLAAIFLAAPALGARTAALATALIMAAGGLLFARRVAWTMSRRIVRLNHTQGVAANLIAAGLIMFASQLGLPVSTTHVSVGAIAGVGAGAQSIDWSTARAVLLSWVVTLPLAAAAACAVAALLRAS